MLNDQNPGQWIDADAKKHRLFPKKPPFAMPVMLESGGRFLLANDCELILSTNDATLEELTFIAQCVNSARMREANIMALETAVRDLLRCMNARLHPTSAGSVAAIEFATRVLAGDIRRKDAPALYERADDEQINP